MSVLHHKASAALLRGLKDSAQISNRSGHCAMYASNQDNDAVTTDAQMVHSVCFCRFLRYLLPAHEANHEAFAWAFLFSLIQPVVKVLFAVTKNHD